MVSWAVPAVVVVEWLMVARVPVLTQEYVNVEVTAVTPVAWS